MAGKLSARALAREVRAVDRRAREPLDAESDEEERVGVVLRLTPRARARWWSARQVANRVAGHPLSHGAFAEVLAAEVLSGVPLDAACDPESLAECSAERGEIDDTGGSGCRSPRRGVRRFHRFPWMPEVAALEQDLESADAFELDRRLRLAVQMEARGLARVASLLSDVVDVGPASGSRLPQRRRLRRGAARHGAEPRAGALAHRARRAGCAPLRKAFAEGRLSWVQAHILVPLLLEPAAARHREDWVAHAQRVTVRRLGDDVERALAFGDFAPPPLAPSARRSMRLRRRPRGSPNGCHPTLQKENERLFFRTHPEVAQLFRAVLATVQRRIERIRGRPCRPSDALEAMLDHALATWRPKKRTRRDYMVFERDGWRCTAPGCSSYRNLHRHHIVFRSHQGSESTPISPRCARGTTSAECTGTSCAAPASRRTGCASSWVCGRTARRSRSTDRGRCG